MDFRVGTGFDSHVLKSSGKLIVGGVVVSQEIGVLAHSDGDALCHAVIDAILGAAGMGDIGELFPDTDPNLKGARSIELLEETWKLVSSKGFELVNLDAVVVLKRPKLLTLRDKIVENLASALKTDKSKIFVKGKNPEGAFREDSIVSLCTVLLRRDV